MNVVTQNAAGSASKRLKKEDVEPTGQGQAQDQEAEQASKKQNADEGPDDKGRVSPAFCCHRVWKQLM